MTTLAPAQDWRLKPSGLSSRAVLYAAGLCILALQLHLALTRSISWDEYHFIRQVYEYLRGDLTTPLNTVHVRVFAWLPGLPGATVDQIVAGRIVMFGAMIWTSAMIAITAQRFAEQRTATLCALAYLSFSYVLQHGSAFRVDPLAASLCMTGLAVLTRAKLSPLAVIAAAAALALAFSVTIKIVLWAPAFAGIAWLRWSQSGYGARSALRIAAVPVLAIGLATPIYFWHSANLAGLDETAQIVGNSGSNMFGLKIQANFISTGMLLSLPFSIIFALAIKTLASGQRHSSAERWALAGLLAPFATVIFYTNAFPYYYAFMLPPVCAGLVAAMPPIIARYNHSFLALAFAGSAGLVWALDDTSRQPEQRAIEAAVDTIFTDRVAYFDFPGFLPRHDKANFFMTTWGVRNYAASGEAHFADAMAKRPVPMLLTVEPPYNPYLLAAMEGGERENAFLAADLTALQETYRRFWGPIYLAGTIVPAGKTARWNVRVPGTYTVEGTLNVDGDVYGDGTKITLDRGDVNLAASPSGKAGLLFGSSLTPPSEPAPARPYWTDF